MASSTGRPYYRTVRQFADDKYSDSGRWQYVRHPKYAEKPSNYIRAFFLLQDDLINLFKYIEPADTNLQTYSFRIHELLTRTCIEIEANLRAILLANKYEKATKNKTLTIEDYQLIENSHYLSHYLAKVPYWSENYVTAIRQPFKPWGTGKPSLGWYQAYNATKHDRTAQLHKANLENLLDAFSALVIVLSAQFMFEDFSPGHDFLSIGGSMHDGFDVAIGGYFRVSFPSMMPERYSFKWTDLELEDDPFVPFDYDAIR